MQISTNITINHSFLRLKKYEMSTYKGEKIIMIYVNTLGTCVIITEKSEYDMTHNISSDYQQLIMNESIYEGDSILCDLQNILDFNISKY